MKLVNAYKILLVSLSGLIALSSDAAQLCIVRLDCPGNYHNDTVRVDESVIALNKSFAHCTPDSVNETLPGRQPDTISVFFLIDHSGSMSFMDSTAIRYRVVNQIIDSIYAHSPVSEIGLAVFSNQLLHNYTDDPFYSQLNPGWHDSYIPLTRLSDSVNGIPAIDKLKQSIQLSATDRDYGNNYLLVNGNYSPTGRKDSLGNNIGYNGTTDISLAFEAARKAFLSAENPRDKQYIVLLSDGISQNVDTERKPYELDYINGVNVPTTFTAFFVNANKPIPQQISSMTENIKINGYSDRNPISKEWKTMGSESELLNDLLMDLSVGNGTEYYLSIPVSLTVNGITTTDFDDSLAFLPKSIPLLGKYTDLNISFKVHWDLPIDKDEIRTFSTVVMQSDNPDGFPDSCFDQGILKFFYQGNQISYIESQQKTIEVRFYPTEGLQLNTVNISISNSDNTDSIMLQAYRNGEYYSAEFNREYGTQKQDQILQNAFVDSVIAVYRNPELPLDTLRIAARVSEPRDIAIQSAYYLDTDANGYPDVIRVIQGTEKLTASEDSMIMSKISVLTPHSFSIKAVVPGPDGFDILLDESFDTLSYTGIFSNERLYIERVELQNGGELPETDVFIADSMAPVIIAATYFDHVENSVPDSFEVIFSEKIDSFTELQPFTLLSISQDIEYKLRLNHLKEDSVSLFSVTPVIGIPNPQRGDSINILSAAGIKDNLSNDQQNPDNIRRAIQYYLLYTISGAAYFDTTGDGLIDMVQVYMPVAPDSMLLDQLYEKISLPQYRNFSYNADDLHINGDGFVIQVKQPSGTEPYTATDSRDLLNIAYTEASNGSIIRQTSVPITDSMAPVLIVATFIPKSGNDEKETDSLRAKLSENIAVPSSNQPFTFLDPVTGKTYSMDLKYCSQDSQSAYMFSIVDIIGKEFPQAGDSISINPAAGVRDQNGNIQDSVNRYSQLQFITQKYDYNIISYPNPFDPQRSVIPIKVIDNYGLKTDKGIVIIAEPKSQMAGYVDLEGNMTIYDAVGGKIIDISGETVRTGKGVSFVWNGENNTGRRVGTGTYLAIITLKDTQGSKCVKKHKIGVRRSIHTEKYFSFERH